MFVLQDGASLLRCAECLELCRRHADSCSIRINKFCPPSCLWAIASPTLKLIVPKMLNTEQPRFAEQQKSVDNIHCLISMLYLAQSNNVEHAIFSFNAEKTFSQYICFQ